MQIESKVKRLIDKYKEKLKKDSKCIMYDQNRLKGYLDGLRDGIGITIELTQEDRDMYENFIKKYLKV